MKGRSNSNRLSMFRHSPAQTYAGAVKKAVFYKYKARGLKVLTTTPTLSEQLFVTHSKFPVSIRRSLRHALLALKDDLLSKPYRRDDLTQRIRFVLDEVTAT